MRTHYQNLKITENAPPEVVKAAYRALCQRYHPDRNPEEKDAERIMKIINAAYDIISDPEKRRKYDQFLAENREKKVNFNSNLESDSGLHEGSTSRRSEFIRKTDQIKRRKNQASEGADEKPQKRKVLFLILALLIFYPFCFKVTKGRVHDVRKNLPRYYLNEKNNAFIEFLLVKGGVLSSNSRLDREILPPFFISSTEITFRDWEIIRSLAASRGYSDLAGIGKGLDFNHPVTHVNWYDAVKWCNAWSEIDNKVPCYTVGELVYREGEIIPQINHSANGYRLPREAEWEFAATGGIHTRDYTFSGSDFLSDVGFYSRNSSDKTHLVSIQKQNEIGAFDMSGNISEWCFTGKGTSRALRGGNWSSTEAECATRYRNFSDANVRNSFSGFRVAVNVAP